MPGRWENGLYHLMFCLREDDNGRSDNPHLHPVLDDNNRAKRFSSLASAFETRNRLGRLASDLVYYAARVRSDIPDR